VCCHIFNLFVPLTHRNIRDDMLSSVLDHPVSILAHITSENQVVIRGEG
jgi:hypothetical protein